MLTTKILVKRFRRKNNHKKNKKEFRIENNITKKQLYNFLSENGITIQLIDGYIKNIYCKMSYYKEPKSYGKKGKKEDLALSNHATKSDVKGATGIHTSRSAKNAELTRIKSYSNELDIEKLKADPGDLGKLLM